MKRHAPPRSAIPGQNSAVRASIASPPTHVWMPNQPQATIARSIDGRCVPRTPKAARANTGKGMP
jgi:hypothetical protein